MLPSESIHILYIEDDIGLARLLQRKMSREGCRVDIAHDGPAGLAILEKEPYDVLLTDYKLPGFSGLEVIRRLAAAGRLPPTVMVTGAGDESKAVEAMKLGVGDYIVKDTPGYLDLLPLVIEKMLNQKRLVDAREKAENEIRQANGKLEKLVYERTEELLQVNNALKLEIIERQRAEKLLCETSEKLERTVEHRTTELKTKTVNLEEMNVALNVLLKKRENDRQDLEKRFLNNVKTLILPYLEKLKSMKLSASQKVYLEILETNIHQIASPLASQLSSRYFNLTPTEIRVANLVKGDKTSKEIAEAFQVSESAIIYHRHNIRKKLDLNNKKINLRTYLQSLQQ